MRILCLDVGSKTIGVAVSDPMGWTAQGVTTIRRQTREADLVALSKLVRDYEVQEILVGLPLNMNGTEGPQAIRMRGFAEELGRGLKLPVVLWDERLTTVAAEEFLRGAEVSGKKRRRVIDKMAAVFILQDHLNATRGGE